MSVRSKAVDHQATAPAGFYPAGAECAEIDKKKGKYNVVLRRYELDGTKLKSYN